MMSFTINLNVNISILSRKNEVWYHKYSLVNSVSELLIGALWQNDRNHING
jgi:hypothetical protein